MSRADETPGPLHHRLRNLGLLHKEDERLLGRMLKPHTEYAQGQSVLVEGASQNRMHVLLRGWAIRYRTLPDGERQIINLLLPGDTIGLYGMLFPRAWNSVDVITDAVLSNCPREVVLEVFDASSRLGAALCWLAGQHGRMLEQQIVRLGRLDAKKRIAHLLLELLFRQVTSGATPAEAATMPMPQTLIAETLGLTPVHVNRSLRWLVKNGWVATGSGALEVLDPEALGRYCEFDHGSINAGVVTDTLRKRLSQTKTA